MNTQQIEDQGLMNLYKKRGISIVRGKGVLVYDDRENKYLDLSGQYGVAILGHSHPYIVKEAQKQLKKMTICHLSFYNDARARFIKELLLIVPQNLKRAYLCSCGAESVEAAIKFARAATGKSDIISTNNSYHGRTLGALSATGSIKHRKPYAPLIPGFSFVPYGDIGALKKEITKNTAAFIIEPIQGEGGVKIPSKEFLQEAKKICQRKNIIFILDEVQTGIGRTGKWFACQHFKIIPDIMTISKAVAGGIPLAATITTENIAEKIPAGTHGSTFGGNPFSCALGAAVILYIKKHNLLKDVREKGNYFLQQLRKIKSPRIREIRGQGLMIGIELREKVSKYLRMLQSKGIIAIPAGNLVIRFLPPYVITKRQIDQAVKVLKNVLK